MDDPFNRAMFGPAVFYEDPAIALDWLENAFGFRRSMVITDPDGKIVHAEMRLGDGYIMVGPAWADFVAAPPSVGGKNTQLVHVRIEGNIDAHYQQAQAAGAEILAVPEDQFYGDRSYRARDPGGHVWTFWRSLRRVPREEMEEASGLKIDIRP